VPKASAKAANSSSGFTLLESFERVHVTPWGAGQRFLHALLQRRGHPSTPGDLADSPLLGDALAASGVTPRVHPGGWLSPDGIYVDIMVPEALAGPGTRGARLGPHGKRAARRAKGLEGALIDRQRHTIASFDPSDQRTQEIWVAGPAALVVAKLIKIGERFDAQDRVRDKDALDLFRLLQAVPTDQLAAGLVLVSDDPTARDVTAEALAVLIELFTTADGTGIEMTIRAAGTPAASETIRASMVILATDLIDAMGV
jgi:hypothetical protein